MFILLTVYIPQHIFICNNRVPLRI
uniref:Uncharacterized protein n=1 Tax=Anguilla anguilla TaxID=7936 RepID=A0A0E9VIQ4_ANGAN